MEVCKPRWVDFSEDLQPTLQTLDRWSKRGTGSKWVFRCLVSPRVAYDIVILANRVIFQQKVGMPAAKRKVRRSKHLYSVNVF